MASIKKNFMYQTIWQILSMILPLITSPILSRTLGAEGIGIHSYISAVTGYFILAANLGMYKYGIREIAAVRDDKEKRSQVFWEIWFLHCVMIVIVGFFFVCYIARFAEYRLYFSVAFFSYLGGVININWLFFGMEDFKKVVVRSMAIKLISTVLIVCFIRTSGDLMKYLVIMAGGNLISNLIYWVLYREYVSKVKISWKNAFARWKGMFILFAPVLLESLYASMDKIMLGSIHTKDEVGYYENADKALIARTIIYSISLVLMPRMSSLLANGDRKQVDQIMRKSTNITIFLASAFGFGTMAVAKEFSILFWGEDFNRCTNLIIIMALAMPGVALSREIREQYLIPAGKDKEYLLSAAAGTVCNFIVNIMLIPKYGAGGAAVATLISEYAVFIVQIIVIWEEFPMLSYIKGNGWYILFGVVMFWAVRVMGETLGIHVYSLLLEIVFGAIVYMILCILFWKASSQNYYFTLFKTIVRRKR